MLKKVFMCFVALLAIAAAAAGPVRAQSITCSADDLGKVICTDGSIYATVSAATTAGKTAAAMIAYVDETNLNGLALALAEDGDMNWSTANGASGAAAHTPTVTGQAWKLPSVAEFKQMLKAFGGNEDSYTGLNTAVTNTGGTPFETDDDYWTSTEHSSASGRGTEMEFFGESNYVDWSWSLYASSHRVRACFSFSVVLTPKYTVRMAAGTEDAANWSIASGNASVPGTQVLEGVIAGSTFTATYVGDLKVKEVIATKHQEPTPLTIEALTAGTIVVRDPQSGMQYTLNGGPKTAMTESPTEITVAVGDKVAFYGNGTSITSYGGTTIAGGTAEVKAYGNIMSLVNETGFDTATTLTTDGAFYYLFQDYANLKDISGLKLPATTLTMRCYESMFSYCTGLTTVPSDLLPATTLARKCYRRMFTFCEHLTNVPTLPANTLARECYDNMFSYCAGLTTVPTDLLPATTLAEGCYSEMFYYCPNLTTAPALPATTLVERCYSYMFSNCSNLSSVTCLATSGINQYYSTENWLDGAGSYVPGTKTVNAASSANWPMDNDNGIPSGWTRQNIDN